VSYGRSVAVNEDYALVGAPGVGSGGTVFVYFFSNQTLVTTLTGTSVGTKYLGHSVSMSGSLVAMGCPEELGGKLVLYHNWQVVRVFRDENNQYNAGWCAIINEYKIDLTWLGTNDPRKNQTATGGGVYFFVYNHDESTNSFHATYGHGPMWQRLARWLIDIVEFFIKPALGLVQW